MDGQIARESGALCGRAKTSDVIDASVAVTAARAARRDAVGLITSDHSDISLLLNELGADVRVIAA